MKFKDFLNSEEPAYEVFNLCMDTVFDENDNEHLERITPEGRLVYLLWCFDGEIHNGGFNQLFFNSLGDHCIEILESLGSVGANISSRLLKDAIKWFPDSKPSKDQGERWEQMEPFEEDEKYLASLDDLDEEFYKYEDNLADLLHQYVRENLEASVLV